MGGSVAAPVRRAASQAKPGGGGVFDADNCFASGPTLLERGAGDPITGLQRATFAYFWALRSKSKSARRDETLFIKPIDCNGYGLGGKAIVPFHHSCCACPPRSPHAMVDEPGTTL